MAKPTHVFAGFTGVLLVGLVLAACGADSEDAASADPSSGEAGSGPGPGQGESTTPADSGVTDATADAGPTTAFGNYLKPFCADSPWNSRPVDPVLGTATIPEDAYFPEIAGGKWSTMFALASATDPPRTVYPLNGAINLVYATTPSVTIPHWPPSAKPAAGSDGHLDIFDPTTNIVHSFWIAKVATSGPHAGEMVAQQYNWTRIEGRGWGDPALFYQGARATAVPTIGGIIRSHEIDDGDTMYRHALAMSLTFSGLSANPTFVFPATSADGTAASTNKGNIPEGALLMLPSTFDTSKIVSPKLRKVAETLKVYGGRVVDRNTGTPYVIYVEGVTDTFGLHGSCPDYKNGWSNACAADLQRIRAALRPLESAASWVDGDGKPFADLSRKIRMIAGRGSVKSSNLTKCQYDSVNDRIQVASGAKGSNAASISETVPAGVTPRWAAGKTYVLSVEASAPGITASLVLLTASGQAETARIGNGQTAKVVAPAGVNADTARIDLALPDNTTGWIHVSAVEE